MLVGLATFAWMQARTWVDIGSITKVLWLVGCGLISLVAAVIGGLGIGFSYNGLAKAIRREPAQSQKMTVSKEGVHSLLTGFVPWAMVSEFHQLYSDGDPMRFWVFQGVGLRRWNLELDLRAPGTDGDLLSAVETHWGNASAACHDNGLPHFVWALSVDPRVWAAYLRLFPFLLFGVSVVLFFVLRHFRVGDEWFLALVVWAFAWCAWKVWGDVWFQWATGLECPQVFLIRNSMLMDRRGVPLVALSQSQWAITIQVHEPWASKREILSFRLGSSTLIQLTSIDADDRSWRRLIDALNTKFPQRPNPTCCVTPKLMTSAPSSNVAKDIN